MKRLIKQSLVAAMVTVVSVASFVAAPSAQAAEKIYTGTLSKKAVSGYDTVSYFTQGKPVKGSDKFKTEHNGATWLFSSQANLDAFVANPSKYAPQYGGHCAFAVGEYNDLVSADPEAWKIADGKLYLNYNRDIHEKWVAKQSEYITKGDANWPGLNK